MSAPDGLLAEYQAARAATTEVARVIVSIRAADRTAEQYATLDRLAAEEHRILAALNAARRVARTS